MESKGVKQKRNDMRMGDKEIVQKIDRNIWQGCGVRDEGAKII